MTSEKAQQGKRRTISYEVETEASSQVHQHGELATRRHTREWYEAFGGKCPTCGKGPEFEMVEVEPFQFTTKPGQKVTGLKPGGKW